MKKNIAFLFLSCAIGLVALAAPAHAGLKKQQKKALRKAIKHSLATRDGKIDGLGKHRYKVKVDAYGNNFTLLRKVKGGKSTVIKQGEVTGDHRGSAKRMLAVQAQIKLQLQVKNPGKNVWVSTNGKHYRLSEPGVSKQEAKAQPLLETGFEHGAAVAKVEKNVMLDYARRQFPGKGLHLVRSNRKLHGEPAWQIKDFRGLGYGLIRVDDTLFVSFSNESTHRK
jgi:hypothetical protein